jgi:hypothetical protein
MIQFVLPAFIVLAVLGFTAYIYRDSQKRFEALQEQLKAQHEMLMAGSFEEWKRIKEGKEAVPNEIKEEPNFQELSEDNRIPFGDIASVQVDEGPKANIKLYR